MQLYYSYKTPIIIIHYLLVYFRNFQFGSQCESHEKALQYHRQILGSMVVVHSLGEGEMEHTDSCT